MTLPEVTVVGPKLLWADVYATAAVARGPTALDWLDGVDRYEAMMVSAFGPIGVITGWPAP
jgi:thiamine biosynthesis lipoprotein